MSSALVPAVVIGGVVYTLSRDSSAPTTAPGQPTKYTAPSGGSTIAQAQLQSAGQLDVAPSPTKVSAGASALQSRLASPAFLQRLSQASAYTPAPGTIDAELQQKYDEAERYAQKAFNDANAVAKGKAADWLNEQFHLNPKLTGHEDWKTVEAVISAAAGAAAAAAGCAATGVGTSVASICARVGALVGAYLGVKLADFADKSYAETKAWLASKWGSLEDTVTNAVHDAIDWINPF